MSRRHHSGAMSTREHRTDPPQRPRHTAAGSDQAIRRLHRLVDGELRGRRDADPGRERPGVRRQRWLVTTAAGVPLQCAAG